MEPKMTRYLWQADAASTLRQNDFQDKCVKMTTKWTLNKERSAVVPFQFIQFNMQKIYQMNAITKEGLCNYVFI